MSLERTIPSESSTASRAQSNGDQHHCHPTHHKQGRDERPQVSSNLSPRDCPHLHAGKHPRRGAHCEAGSARACCVAHTRVRPLRQSPAALPAPGSFKELLSEPSLACLQGAQAAAQEPRARKRRGLAWHKDGRPAGAASHMETAQGRRGEQAWRERTARRTWTPTLR